jgi:hypothetical protein
LLTLGDLIQSTLPYLFEKDGPGFDAAVQGVPAPLDGPLLDVSRKDRATKMNLIRYSKTACSLIVWGSLLSIAGVATASASRHVFVCGDQD